MLTKIKRSYRKNSSIYFSYAMAIVMYIVVSILKPEFATIGQIRLLTAQAAILGILAVGQTFAILLCGIDLSIQWTLNGAAVLFVMMCKSNGIEGGWAEIGVMAICCLLGAAVGMFKGFGIAYLNISPLIMTYGVNVIIQGITVGLTHNSFAGGYTPADLQKFVMASPLGLPNIVWVWLVVAVIITLLLWKTPFGRKVYAIGNNESVAHYSGIDTRMTKMIAYGISGLFAAFGGILYAGKITNAYLGMGDFILFQSIAVVAIGGTSMSGGRGNYIGTIAGALVLTIANGMLSAFMMPDAVKNIVYGVILLVAVYVTILRQNQGKKAVM